MKNRTPWHRIILMSTGILAVVPVKCHSILDKRAPTEDDGYEYVTLSGSQIPQRVPKGKVLVTTSPLEVTGGESIKNTRRNQTMGPLPGATGR